MHAGGSGIGSIAIRIAKALGCTVITTVGSDDKAAKARALGADHVINYRTDRFEGVVRRLTGKKGVDVVFEHTGADTWTGSLLSLKRGGRLVTCGATSGPSGSINLMQLFQQQYRIIGSFGSPLRALRPRAGPHRVRRAAGDRHASTARRIPRRRSRGWSGATCSARSWSNSEIGAVPRQLARVYGDRLLGRLVKYLLAALRRTDPDRASDICGAIMRRIGPLLPAHRIGQANLRAAFPDKDAAWIERNAARCVGKSWPRRRRIRASRADSGTTTPSIPTPAASSPSDATAVPRPAATTASPALCFAAHLANWELPAVMAAAHGLPSAVLYRMPNNKAVAARDHPHPRAADGPADPQPRAGAVGDGRGTRPRRASRHAGRPAFLARRGRHVLRPPLQGQSDDRPPRPPVRLSGGRRARDPAA